MTKDKIGMFPGTFDPIHQGHLDIIKRASKLFDKLYVVISINIYKMPTNSKAYVYQNVLREVETLGLSNVEVAINRELTIDFAKKHQCNWIIRSVRNKNDLEYELVMAQSNHYLANKIETLLMVANDQLKSISSSGLRLIEENLKKIKGD